jgi:hypothetical protein
MGYEKFATKSDSQIARHIRTIAKDSSCVFFTTHVKVRMTQRKVTAPEVLECIRTGTISRTPETSSDGKSLECRMERYVAGRNLGVVVALCDEDPSIVLVTVFLMG